MEQHLATRAAGIARRSRVTPLALALALTAGGLLALRLPILPGLGTLLAIAATAVLPWRGRVLWMSAILGFLAVVAQGSTRIDDRWPATRHGERHTLRGTVVDLPARTERDDAAGTATWRFAFEPEDTAFPRLLRASWYRSEERPRGGECWVLDVALRAPHGSLNPGAGDYEAWLLRRDIGATASVRSGHRCDATSGHWILRLRQFLVDRYEAWLPDHPGLPWIAALTIGDDSGIDDRDWDALRITGTSHLIAISGFNVAIVAGIVWWMLRWSWGLSAALALRMPAQRAAAIAAALTGIAYALLAGWDPPVQRAAIMLPILLVAGWRGLTASPFSALAWAWIVVVLLEPLVLLDPGLWLSFGAVVGILFLSSARRGRPPVWRAAVRLQLGLSVLLVPMTLHWFSGATWLAPLVNLVAVPLVGVLTPVLLAALLLALAWPEAGVPVLQACAEAVSGLREGLLWVADAAPGMWLAARPPDALLLVGMFGCVLLLAPRGLPLRLPGLLCLGCLLLPAPALPDETLQISVLDVGQGTAVVIRTAHHTMLYDTGPAWDGGFDAGDSVVVPYLLEAGVRRLDTLMVSHGDLDHAGGVEAVRRRMAIGREIGTSAKTVCVPGEAWDWDGVRFQILHPRPGYWSGNNASCVLRVDGPYSVLLPGDIEASAEAWLLEKRPDSLAADVLLAPHHGSRTSSTPAFVSAVRPQLVVFAAGWRSRFGHPKPEVVARYEAAGVERYTTGVDGAIEIGPAGADRVLDVSAWRRRDRRWWRAPAEP